jgi:hypothetical protein
MSKPVDPQHQARVHKLTAELRQLQARLNDTVDQLCELMAGSRVEEALAGLAPAVEEGPVRKNTLQPSFLLSPVATPYARNPSTGFALSPDARFYSNYKRGLVQIVQQPLARHADSRYSLVLNYADFDGDLLSVVVDARSLLAGLPAGKARLDLVVETVASQFSALYAKCAWRSGKTWSERNFEVRGNQVSVASVNLDTFDPAAIQVLDVHLLFNPSSRGSVEIRRLTASLSVEPIEDTTADVADVFENAH